jgi:hypothetical protein
VRQSRRGNTSRAGNRPELNRLELNRVGLNRPGLNRLGPNGIGWGNEMRSIVASLIVLSVLFFWDKDYNNGRLLSGLDRMRQDISRHMFR